MGHVVIADNMTTLDGTVFRNVVIISADPVRMLIVHDGGGCQIDFVDLVPDSLTPRQRREVEAGIREYTGRKAKMERLRLEKETFELAQRKKGLVPFEDGWMTPAEKQELLARRELHQLERERLRLELEEKKAERRKQELLARKGDELLTPPRQSYFLYSSGYYSSTWCGCHPALNCNHSSKTYGRRSWIPACPNEVGRGISFSSGGVSISRGNGVYSTSRVSPGR